MFQSLQSKGHLKSVDLPKKPQEFDDMMSADSAEDVTTDEIVTQMLEKGYVQYDKPLTMLRVDPIEELVSVDVKYFHFRGVQLGFYSKLITGVL